MRGDRILRKLGLLAVPALLCQHAGVAEAYVGPGAGFAAGSIVGVFLAFFAALLSILTWPIRFGFRSFRRRKALRRARVKRMVDVEGLPGEGKQTAESQRRYQGGMSCAACPFHPGHRTMAPIRL